MDLDHVDKLVNDLENVVAKFKAARDKMSPGGAKITLEEWGELVKAGTRAIADIVALTPLVIAVAAKLF